MFFRFSPSQTLAVELSARLEEEFVLHLLPHRLHESRAHRADESADLARLALEFAPLTLARDPDPRRPFHQVRAVVRASDAEAAGDEQGGATSKFLGCARSAAPGRTTTVVPAAECGDHGEATARDATL